MANSPNLIWIHMSGDGVLHQVSFISYSSQKGWNFLDGSPRLHKLSGEVCSPITSYWLGVRYGTNLNFKKWSPSIGLFFVVQLPLMSDKNVCLRHWILDACVAVIVWLSLNYIDFSIVLSTIKLGNGHLTWSIHSMPPLSSNGTWTVFLARMSFLMTTILSILSHLEPFGTYFVV